MIRMAVLNHGGNNDKAMDQYLLINYKLPLGDEKLFTRSFCLFLMFTTGTGF